MKIETIENKKIMAEEGKVLRRKSDGQLFGTEIDLGYTYYLAGERLENPLTRKNPCWRYRSTLKK